MKEVRSISKPPFFMLLDLDLGAQKGNSENTDVFSELKHMMAEIITKLTAYLIKVL